MKHLRRHLLGIGGVLAVVLALTLMVPKAGRALVATLVQVVNTTANPVPTFISARSAYTSVRVLDCSGAPVCGSSFDAAPAGYRLVVENVSGSLAEPIGGTPPAAILSAPGVGAPHWGIPGAVGSPDGGGWDHSSIER